MILIIYDSLYGNTEKITRVIAGAFAPTEDVQVHLASEVNPAELGAIGLLIVGSPTQGGRPTKAIQDFLNKVQEPVIKAIKVAAFDTRISTRWVGIFGYAAGKIARSLKTKGGTLILSPEGFFVKGNEGPLEDGEEARAATWAAALINKKDR